MFDGIVKDYESRKKNLERENGMIIPFNVKY